MATGPGARVRHPISVEPHAKKVDYSICHPETIFAKRNNLRKKADTALTPESEGLVRFPLRRNYPHQKQSNEGQLLSLS